MDLNGELDLKEMKMFLIDFFDECEVEVDFMFDFAIGDLIKKIDKNQDDLVQK